MTRRRSHVRSPPARRCACGKWLYRSYGRATRVLNRLAEPGHLYWSAPCGGYHITSLTPAEHDRRQAQRLNQPSANEGSNP